MVFWKVDFIVPFAKQFMNFTKNSVLNPHIDKKNLLEGLYALALTAICVNLFFASEFLFLYFNLKG